MSELTIQEFEMLLEEAYKIKSAADVKEAEWDELKEQLRHKQTQILAVLNELDKSSYKSKYGTVVRMTRFSVRTPKDPDSKKAFFDYLESKGIREQMTSVNSQTLNSWYRQELEQAREAGKEATFNIPGLEEPTYSEVLTMRK